MKNFMKYLRITLLRTKWYPQEKYASQKLKESIELHRPQTVYSSRTLLNVQVMFPKSEHIWHELESTVTLLNFGNSSNNGATKPMADRHLHTKSILSKIGAHFSIQLKRFLTSGIGPGICRCKCFKFIKRRRGSNLLISMF